MCALIKVIEYSIIISTLKTILGEWDSVCVGWGINTKRSQVQIISSVITGVQRSDTQPWYLKIYQLFCQGSWTWHAWNAKFQSLPTDYDSDSRKGSFWNFILTKSPGDFEAGHRKNYEYMHCIFCVQTGVLLYAQSVSALGECLHQYTLPCLPLS